MDNNVQKFLEIMAIQGNQPNNNFITQERL